MKHANILKKELGLQLGILRLKQGKKLSRVATDLGWQDQVIDQIENGYHHSWKRYYELLKYYHGTIGIMLDK